MKLTDSARARLERYLREVRTALAVRSDVDPEDVVAGIREHVETDLEASERSAPVTQAELDAVLARLGSAAEVVGAAGEAGSDEMAGAAAPGHRGGLGVTALLLGFGGAALVLAGVWAGVGWLGLSVGAVLARVVVGAAVRPSAEEPIDVLLRFYWTTAAAAMVAVSVLFPAAIVWTLAQTGGPLHAPATAAWGGGAAPYWRWVAAAAGSATGTWWVLLGLVLRTAGDAARRALGPASYLLPKRSARVLLLAGGVVLIISTLEWIL